MKSLTFFLRTALAQFTTLLNVLIRALQIQRRVQLIAVLVASILIGFFVARTVHSTRATQQQWASHVSILVTSRNLAVLLCTCRRHQEEGLPSSAVATDLAAEPVSKGSPG